MSDTLFGMRVPIAWTLSLVGQSMTPEGVVIEMPFDERFTNSRGDIGGGAITTALDLALAAAVRSHAPDEFSVSTVELSTHFIAACQSSVRVLARCTSRGKRICFANGEARDAQDRLVASASGVFVLIPRSG